MGGATQRTAQRAAVVRTKENAKKQTGKGQPLLAAPRPAAGAPALNRLGTPPQQKGTIAME